MMHEGLRADIRRLRQRLDDAEKSLIVANRAFNECQETIIALHRENSALALVVRERMQALDEVVRTAPIWGLRRRLRKIRLSITVEDLRAAAQAVMAQIQALVDAGRAEKAQPQADETDTNTTRDAPGEKRTA